MPRRGLTWADYLVGALWLAFVATACWLAIANGGNGQ
jgi:hypothetical protein